MYSHKNSRFWIVAIAPIMFAGCTSLQPLDSTQPDVVSSIVEVGDEVEIRKTTGHLVRMEVEEVAPAGLRGDDQFVDYLDMASIKVRQFDEAKAGRTMLITAGVLLAVGLTVEALEDVAEVYTGP